MGRLLGTLGLGWLLAAAPASAEEAGGHAFRIQFDYRFDVDGYFDDPVARANLEEAARLWSEVIQDDFPTVPAGTPILVLNPHTLQEERVVLEYDIDDLVVFVGSSEHLDGMARAGPTTRWYRRLDRLYPADGDARILGDDFEPWAGFLSINPSSEIPLVLDPTPRTSDDLPMNSTRRYDFLTLALHEMGHVLGIGTCRAFQRQSGLLAADGLSTKSTDDGRLIIVSQAFSVFYGPHARRLNANQPVRLSEDRGHLATRFIVAGQQDLMDQDLNTVRQLPTPVDTALLADLGYEITPGR